MDADKRAARAHAVHVAHVTRERGLRVLSRTQRGEHARAKAKAHYKQGEGKRDTAREAALAASSRLCDDFQKGFEAA